MPAPPTDADFRLGLWQDVLADVGEVDLIVTDPPYSPRTHDGERGLRVMVHEPGYVNHPRQLRTAPANSIGYAPITEDEIAAFVSHWSERARHWAICFGDHTSFLVWEAAWAACGWLTFAPVAWVKRNAPPRFSGDGPASACEYLCIVRPHGRVRDTGSRPGYYLVDVPTRPQNGGSTGMIGVKDVGGLRRLVVDYSRPGDLVCDPYAGTATVGAACIGTGRRYVGAEVDPQTYGLGHMRLAAVTPPLPGFAPERVAQQLPLEET